MPEAVMHAEAARKSIFESRKSIERMVLAYEGVRDKAG